MQALESQKRLEQVGWIAHGLGLAATIVLCVAAYVFLLLPIDQECVAIDNSLASTIALIATSDDVRDRHAEMLITVADAKLELEDLLVRIPESPKDAEFLAEVSDLARRSGMNVESFEPAPSATRASYHEMNIKLKTRASYEALCRVVDQLGRSHRLCRVDHMKVETDVAAQDYKVEFSITIFFVPETPSTVAKR